MSKRFFVTLLAVGAITMSSVAFAQTTSTSSVATTTAIVATTTVSTKIQCVSVAVNTRETSLRSAVSTYTQALSNAYSVRATALEAAYKLTDSKAIRGATKSAWSIFSQTVKIAKKDWMTARNNAWKTYRSVATACKAPANIGDGVNARLEMQ